MSISSKSRDRAKAASLCEDFFFDDNEGALTSFFMSSDRAKIASCRFKESFLVRSSCRLSILPFLGVSELVLDEEDDASFGGGWSGVSSGVTSSSFLLLSGSTRARNDDEDEDDDGRRIDVLD